MAKMRNMLRLTYLSGSSGALADCCVVVITTTSIPAWVSVDVMTLAVLVVFVSDGGKRQSRPVICILSVFAMTQIRSDEELLLGLP